MRQGRRSFGWRPSTLAAISAPVLSNAPLPRACGPHGRRRMILPVFPQTFGDPLRDALAKIGPQHLPRRPTVADVAALDQDRGHARVSQHVEAVLVACRVGTDAA